MIYAHIRNKPQAKYIHEHVSVYNSKEFLAIIASALSLVRKFSQILFSIKMNVPTGVIERVEGEVPGCKLLKM